MQHFYHEAMTMSMSVKREKMTLFSGKHQTDQEHITESSAEPQIPQFVVALHRFMEKQTEQ